MMPSGARVEVANHSQTAAETVTMSCFSPFCAAVLASAFFNSKICARSFAIDDVA